MPLVAAVAGPRERVRLAELVGAPQVTAADLRSGYLPEQSYGHAGGWSSTLKRSWVEPASTPKPARRASPGPEKARKRPR